MKTNPDNINTVKKPNTLMKIKLRVHEVISSPDEPSTASRIFDIVIITLVLINLVSVVLLTFDIPQWLTAAIWYSELVSVIFFTIEYLLRLFVAEIDRPDLPPVLAKFRYMVSFLAVMDLLSILPFYIPFIMPFELRVLRVTRLFRLFRIFKLKRYTNAMSTMGDVFRKKRHQLISSVSLLLALMVISSVLMYGAEHKAQPEVFENLLSSLWWTVETLTTVGYGDVIPVTALGKLLSSVISLLGIGLIAVPTGIITAGFSETIAKKKEPEEKEDVCDKEFCPYCGKKLK